MNDENISSTNPISHPPSSTGRHPRKTFSTSFRKNNDDKLHFERASDHPLLVKATNERNLNRFTDQTEDRKLVRTKQSDWVDPLSVAALSDAKQEPVTFVGKTKRSFIEDDFENWDFVRNSITNKSIALVRSIRIGALLVEHPTTSASLNFIQNLNNLESDLIEAWESNSRVKALRTVSLVAKNLGDIERFDLYAYKFVISVQLLDKFNELVYRRIEDKVNESDIEVAKETCRNWSYKICSIQELLPRLYLEIATLNTFGTFFINDTTDKLVKTTQRLLETVRGIGDPFIAVFVYAYLAKTCLNIFPTRKELFYEIYSDFLVQIEQIKQVEIKLPKFLIKHDLAKPDDICTYLNYTQFYTMPVDWILKCLLYKSSRQESENVYKELNIKLSNYQSSDLFFVLLNVIVPKLNSTFVIENHRCVIELIKTVINENRNSNLPKYQLISNLSAVFLSNDSATSDLSRDSKLNIFKEIWKLIKMLNEKEYIICTNAWIDFAVRYFNMSQINSILNNMIKHVISRKEFIICNEDLIPILIKILNSSTVDYKQFLTSEIFVPFIEMFQKESAKVLACKTVIEHLIKSVRRGDDCLNYSDSDYMSILIYINKTMHDSVDQLTTEEQRRELSSLINEFISLVQFDSHTDHLDYLVSCRSNFSNFNNVIIQLVFNANKLSLEYYEDEEPNSSSFLKGCLAFSCITVPSVDNESFRAMLYLNTAEVSLRCGFIEQTEFFVRSAISTLDLVIYEKLSKTNELFFVGYIKSLLSFLILVPVSFFSNKQRTTFIDEQMIHLIFLLLFI